MSDWTYSGDADLLYGGLFLRDQGSYFDVVEVTDLASATGADNMTLIECGNVAVDRKRADITHAVKSDGAGDFRSMYKLGRTPRAASRAMIAQALWSYGAGDRDIDCIRVLYNADNGDECANCGESIVYRDGQCQHADAIDPTASNPEFILCDEQTQASRDQTVPLAAEPKRPTEYENGHESWPDMLPDDWADYADGAAGVWRYLTRFDISKPASE